VLVAGGFHDRGGMDRATAALARHLAHRGTPVHLVGHEIDPEIAALPGAVILKVSRPAGSILLGEAGLDRAGRRIATRLRRDHPGLRTVVNGGNCNLSDVDWVHAVHAAWPCVDRGAPGWFRVKNRLAKAAARRREAAIVPRARVVVTNSERSRELLVSRLGVPAGRVRVVYLGTDPAWRPADPAARSEARRRLGRPADRPLIAFVGALSHDRTKGFDTLLEAFAALAVDASWNADLLAAGGGNGLDGWRREVERRGLGDRVRLLGFVEEVGELLTAADLLVGPARYEAYGLAAHEAIARGVPALISAASGLAERYPPELGPLLLPDPEDAADLAVRLAAWHTDPEGWRRRFAPLAGELAGWSWDDMAARFVEVAS
jgi:glycosyltransferase involved in cell wall biosynthesis